MESDMTYTGCLKSTATSKRFEKAKYIYLISYFGIKVYLYTRMYNQ